MGSRLDPVDQPFGRVDGSADYPAADRRIWANLLLLSGFGFVSELESNLVVVPKTLRLSDFKYRGRALMNCVQEKLILIVKSIKSLSPLPRGRRQITEPR